MRVLPLGFSSMNSITLPLGTIVQADALETVRGWPTASVQCCITSIPYWGLRDYQVEGVSLKGQYGQEATIEEWLAVMVAVFGEVRRVLRLDGTLWLNVGDAYSTGASGQNGAASTSTNTGGRVESRKRPPAQGFKPKNLLMLPARLAMALQADGWTLRSDIIWSKPNPMPESVTDRPATAHEHVFLLTPGPRYFYDAEAVREEGGEQNGAAANFQRETKEQLVPGQGMVQHRMNREPTHKTSGRNLRNVWTIAPQPYAGAHYATFPEALVEPCIKAGTSERGACPACAAPSRRVVEKVDPNGRLGKSYHNDQGRMEIGHRGVPQAEGAPVTRTVGWVPGCKHAGMYAPLDLFNAKQGGVLTLGRKKKETAEAYAGRLTAVLEIIAQAAGVVTVPCIVLDPFAGTGQAGVVAYKKGREFVGIDLAGGDTCLGARCDSPPDGAEILATSTENCWASRATHELRFWVDKSGAKRLETVDCHSAHDRINAAREGGRSVAEHVGLRKAGQLDLLGGDHV